MSKIIGKGRYATETYPTRSGGGVGANLDQHFSIGIQNDVSSPVIAPGDYYVLGEFLLAALFGSTFISVSDPISPLGPLLFGPEVLPGRIGQARIGRAFDLSTDGSDDVQLQWTVNGIPTGNSVTVPWDQFASVGTITFPQALVIASGDPVDFGNVTWVAGDILLLKATFGNVIGSGSAYIATAFDKIYG
jgi:hypothetical protein